MNKEQKQEISLIIKNGLKQLMPLIRHNKARVYINDIGSIGVTSTVGYGISHGSSTMSPSTCTHLTSESAQRLFRSLSVSGSYIRENKSGVLSVTVDDRSNGVFRSASSVSDSTRELINTFDQFSYDESNHTELIDEFSYAVKLCSAISANSSFSALPVVELSVHPSRAFTARGWGMGEEVKVMVECSSPSDEVFYLPCHLAPYFCDSIDSLVGHVCITVNHDFCILRSEDRRVKCRFQLAPEAATKSPKWSVVPIPAKDAAPTAVVSELHNFLSAYRNCTALSPTCLLTISKAIDTISLSATSNEGDYSEKLAGEANGSLSSTVSIQRIGMGFHYKYNYPNSPVKIYSNSKMVQFTLLTTSKAGNGSIVISSALKYEP